MSYRLAAVQLTKLGEAELAWIAADRGLVAAQHSDDLAVTGSLARSVVHALLSAGKYTEAVRLTGDTANLLRPRLASPTPEITSVYGTLFLAGATAAARAEDRATAFGPTNVDIHRVATAGELGDVQVAIDLGPRVDTSPLPMERRVRHALEVARAYSLWNRLDDALTTLLDAEQLAPEQVRYHYLGRQLTLTWLRRSRGTPSPVLLALARRLHVQTWPGLPWPGDHGRCG